MTQFKKDIDKYLLLEYAKTPEKSTVTELYNAVSKAAMQVLNSNWSTDDKSKKACYFSAEFLVGRLIYSNLMNLGLLEECGEYLKSHGLDLTIFEQIEDDALGNGGLGRLAACFLDSAATHDVKLNGFGIRYRYGLFRQHFENGFQKENADDWMRFGDPWSIRRESESVLVEFDKQIVRAVPYDMPIIGWENKCVNNLRLWQSEPLEAFDFEKFNAQEYADAVKQKNMAEDITKVLYPNDDSYEGKQLRLKQQYFFSSASLQSIIKEFVCNFGSDFSKFPEQYAIQLNDTHPTVSIPELLRLLISEHGLEFNKAFEITQKTFAYTNHTIMAEALEKWNVSLFISVLPEVYPYVVMLQNHLCSQLRKKGISKAELKKYSIIDSGNIHMARLAVFATHSTNGVAMLHSEILKNSALNEWYMLYPERFNNKTNGVTQRRWLALCNPELSKLITAKIGDGWVKDLSQINKLQEFATDASFVEEFMQIKRLKKQQLCEYIKDKENYALSPDFIMDIQIKRLHEYKRQFLNALSILDLYYSIKNGELPNFYPTAFLFGAKAAPGYYRAKGIIKFINEIAKLIENDKEVNKILRVLFVQNYDVSYAEKLIPAADISEQISTAGTEASGTGNMKFMLNGAVTLGTMDGANVEIVEQAGEMNNYIFGATVEEIAVISKKYNPKAIYESDTRIKRVLDSLIDGTFDDGGTGVFKDLYNSLLIGASWHKADQYYILQDFNSYRTARLRANSDYSNREDFAKKCLANTINSGKFSSDRTILQYAKEIWNL